MRESQAEAKLSVTIRPREESRGVVDTVIQHRGVGPEENMKFEVKADFEYVKGKFLSKPGCDKRWKIPCS